MYKITCRFPDVQSAYLSTCLVIIAHWIFTCGYSLYISWTVFPFYANISGVISVYDVFALVCMGFYVKCICT